MWNLSSSISINKQLYRVSQEERTKLREGAPYVKLYRYNPPLQNSPIKDQCFIDFHTVFQSRSTCFISTPFLHSACSSIMNMGVVDSSETLLCFYQTKWHYISILMIIAVRASHLTYSSLHFIKMRTVKHSLCHYNYFI